MRPVDFSARLWGCLVVLTSLFLLLQMTGPDATRLLTGSEVHPPSHFANPQDAKTVDADFVELNTAAKVQDWDTTYRLADKTLDDLKDFSRAARISEPSDDEKNLAGALAHLRDIQESASSDTEAEARRDWHDLNKEYQALKAEAKTGPAPINLASADSHMGELKVAINSKDWPKAKSSAAEARKALRAAYPPAVLDYTHENLGACVTHLKDVKDAADKKISSEVTNDARRAKDEWEAAKEKMVK
jgi:hypothetical protein